MKGILHYISAEYFKVQKCIQLNMHDFSPEMLLMKFTTSVSPSQMTMGGPGMVTPSYPGFVLLKARIDLSLPSARRPSASVFSVSNVRSNTHV